MQTPDADGIAHASYIEAVAKVCVRQCGVPHLELVAKLTGYVAGEDLLALSARTSCPPALLLRRILEAPPICVPRAKVTEALRRPALLPALARSREGDAAAPADLHVSQPGWEAGGDAAGEHNREDAALLARAAGDVVYACQEDPIFSPHADAVRHVSGLEGEALLCEALRARGIAFWPEQQLRAEGFFKTPDVKLQVPLLVRGHVVNWIDSKATFGSARLHLQQTAEQYAKYVNRFGPGAVVYWFGYAAGLGGACPGVLLLDGLPPSTNIVTLPCLDLPR